MKSTHATLAVLLLVGFSLFAPRAQSAESAPVPAAAAPDLSGLADFDFIIGDWRVHHRVMNARTRVWAEFDGISSTRKIMQGAGNLEDNVLHRPGGTYRAAAVRAYDPGTGLWAIWWIDGRSPHGSLDPPVKGRFENGVGRFYSDANVDGKPIRVRYTWSHSGPDAAHWEQAFSTDAGATWETNWTMDFTRR